MLLDDHFATIVAGIEQGRATFLNVRRFLTYHLTDNVAELTPFAVWALSGGRFPLALGVLQIIALDIGTDTMSAVALGAEPPSSNVLAGRPVSGRLLNHTVARRAFGLLGPARGTHVDGGVPRVARPPPGGRPGDTFPTGNALAAASGAAFMAVVFAQAGNAFACRSTTRWPGALGWTSNRLLVPAVGVGLLFAFTVLLVDPIARELEQAVPPLAGWLVALASPIVLLAVDAGDKRWRRRARRRIATPGAPPDGDHGTSDPMPAMFPDRQAGRVLIDEGLELLDERDALRLLANSEVGRVGVTIGALPAIFPVNYRLIDGCVVFRSAPGRSCPRPPAGRSSPSRSTTTTPPTGPAGVCSWSDGRRSWMTLT